MLCDRFVQADTRDYASFRQSFKLTPPQNFNFGFSTVFSSDAISAALPPSPCSMGPEWASAAASPLRTSGTKAPASPICCAARA